MGFNSGFKELIYLIFNLLFVICVLVVICVVRLLYVLFCVFFVCKCVLPPGDNPTAVNIIYHIIYHLRNLETVDVISTSAPSYAFRYIIIKLCAQVLGDRHIVQINYSRFTCTYYELYVVLP